MSRNARNFWLEIEVDGRRAKVATGPISTDVGFRVVVKMRDRGEIVGAGVLTGRAHSDGFLELSWDSPDGLPTTLATTVR